MLRRTSITILIFMVIITNAYAKRAEPVKEIVVSNGKYKVVAINSAACYEKPPYGGYIEVFDSASGDFLWSMQVYKIQHAKGLEKDVQDVYIKHLEFMDQKLYIINDRDMIFSIDLDRKKVFIVQDYDNQCGIPLNTVILKSVWSLKRCNKK